MIRVNNREIPFPPEELNMGEMADAENYFAVDWTNPERSGMRLAAALLYIAIRRVDPTVTVDDVRRLDPNILQQIAGGDVNPPPSSETADSNGRSTSDSPASGDAPPAATPASTGSPGSATGSPGSPP